LSNNFLSELKLKRVTIPPLLSLATIIATSTTRTGNLREI